MTITREHITEVRCEPFGTTSKNEPVLAYVLENAEITARILTYGGILQSLVAADRAGNREDVVLGFDTLSGYEHDTAFHGAIIGRYANRIAEGTFSLDGNRYKLPQNDKSNTLHGGPGGLHTRVWNSQATTNGVELTCVSPDGDEGFPGAVTVTVRYTLLDRDLQIEYVAETDAPTVINLTNHAYFNLSGEGAGEILGHELLLRASHFTPITESLIPTGEIAPVAGTPLDFREPHPIGERIASPYQQLSFAGGFDFNWVLDSPGLESPAAEAHDPQSGRVLQVYTDQPGIQFYSGNFLNGASGKQGRRYHYRSGFCLEAQHFPDAPNHSNFPPTVLRPGEVYRSVTRYRFLAR